MAYKQLTPEEFEGRVKSRMDELIKNGYKWDKELSISYAGVVMRKQYDTWLFDLEGNEYHNPEGWIIDIKK